jgi:hypothetical protein
MDVIRARLQTTTPLPSYSIKTTGGGEKNHIRRHSESELIRQTVRALWREDGWRGFSRGLGARILNMGPTSVMTILTYELVKTLSRID